MSESITIAVLGLLGTLAINFLAPAVNARLGRRKAHAETNNIAVATSDKAAESALKALEKLQVEMERKERDCAERIDALNARVDEDDQQRAEMQNQIADLQMRLDAQEALNRRQAAMLTLAEHQFEKAGIRPMWKDSP